MEILSVILQPMAQATPSSPALVKTAVKDKTTRALKLIDSYTGEDIGSTILVSRIQGIMVGPGHFYSSRGAGSGEYHMDRIGDFWNITRKHKVQGNMPLLSVPADEAGTAHGIRLLDSLVSWDWWIGRAIRNFAEEPEELADRVLRCYTSTEAN